MPTDEFVVMLVGIVAGPISWCVWLLRMVRLGPVRRRDMGAFAIGGALVACTLAIFVVLKSGASPDVVDAPLYLFMYVVLGLAWVRGAATLFPYMGLSPRDDVFERGNHAALLPVIGAMASVTLCYAGGNIGQGPGWWVVVFSAGLATAALLVSWAILAHMTPLNDSVTIDRDRAAGIRLAAYLVSCGLILARGVAGDWVSADATIRDFVMALPAVALVLWLAIVIERLARPTARRPHPSVFAYGVLPGALYLLVAAAALSGRG